MRGGRGERTSPGDAMPTGGSSAGWAGGASNPPSRRTETTMRVMMGCSPTSTPPQRQYDHMLDHGGGLPDRLGRPGPDRRRQARQTSIGQTGIARHPPRWAAEKQQRRQFVQRPPVDMALEGHHGAQRVPVIHPLPVVELGAFGQIQPHRFLAAQHPQQEPDLFLTDAGRLAAVPDQTLGQAVAQPALGAADHLNVLRPQANFFGQLAKHGLLGRFIPLDATTGETARNAARSASPRKGVLLRYTE